MLNEKEMRQEYEEIIKALDSNVDLILCETLSSLKEAICAAQAAKTICKRFISFGVDFYL